MATGDSLGSRFTNYVITALDRILFRSASLPRGLWPWNIRLGFGQSVNLDLRDRGPAFLASRRARGMGAARYTVLRLGIFMGCIVGVWGRLSDPLHLGAAEEAMS